MDSILGEATTFPLADLIDAIDYATAIIDDYTGVSWTQRYHREVLNGTNSDTIRVSKMFPATLLMIPLYVILSRLGLLNDLWGLVLVYSTTAIPFCVWMLKGYFDTIPRSLEEPALADGATPFQAFWPKHSAW
jgi:ABC-type spermidine/putrescine transport system permease subunit II